MSAISENKALLRASKLLLDNGENLDFLTIVGGPWRALGVEAELKNISNKKKKGIILARTKKVDKDDFSFNGINDSYFIKFKSEKDDILDDSWEFAKYKLKHINGFNISHLHKSNGDIKIIIPNYPKNIERVGYLLSEPKINSLIDPKFVLIKNSPTELLSEHQTYKDKSKNRSIKGQFYHKTKSLSQRIYFIKNPPIKRSLYEFNKSGQISPNPSILKNYQEILGSYEYSSNNNEVLFVMSDVYGKGYVNYDAWVETIEYILSSVRNDNNTIILKPHPRQTSESIDMVCEIANNIGVSLEMSNRPKKSVERLIPKLRPNSIVGFYSTSLINANALFGVNCYTTAHILREKTEDPRLSNFLNYYLDYFSRYVKKLE